MSFFRRALAAALVVAAPTVAQASSGSGGYISNVLYTINGGHIYFAQSGPRTAVPACGAGDATRWAMDPSTPSGQAGIAIVLTAYALHKQVYIGGTGNCATASPDAESIFYLYVIG